MAGTVLVTGHHGYIGSVLAPMLVRAGWRVVGLDSDLFAPCILGDVAPEEAAVRSIAKDLRDTSAADFQDIDAVVHLAGLSNDPLGQLDPGLTDEINHRATVRVARLAKQSGARRFLYASSCSLYGAGDTEAALDETARFNPLTAYAVSKVQSERALSSLAGSDFSPTYLRNATAYGFSPRLRGDLVVNELAARALITSRVDLRSDGLSWRPLVHVEDIARAFVAALEAPREVVHDRAYNVGRNGEDYLIRHVADLVAEAVPGSEVTYAEGSGPDTRSYRVDFSRISTELPGFQPQWTVPQGIDQLLDAYRKHGILQERMETRYSRLHWLQALRDQSRLDATLRPVGELADGRR